jgi:hypothetical protein
MSSIVMDNARFINKSRSRSRAMKPKRSDMETLLQQQRIKEKQLLKQWKTERNAEKKTRLIVRKQAHDVRGREKQRFSDMDESEYDERGYIEDRYVWKHEGCNAECREDNCEQYMLEYVCSGYD